MWDVWRKNLNNNATVQTHKHAQSRAPPALRAKHPSKIDCKLFTWWVLSYTNACMDVHFRWNKSKHNKGAPLSFVNSSSNLGQSARMSYNSAEWAHPPTHVSVPSSKENSETTQWPLVYNQSNTGVSALRPATLCYAHYTELAAQRNPAQLWHSVLPFAKLSQFILMTHGKSTWPIYEAVSAVSVSAALLVHQAEIQVLQEMTVWNLNISNHGKCNIHFSRNLGHMGFGTFITGTVEED